MVLFYYEGRDRDGGDQIKGRSMYALEQSIVKLFSRSHGKMRGIS